MAEAITMGELFTYDLLITIKRLSKLKIVVGFYDVQLQSVVRRLFIVLNGSSVNYHGNQSMIASHQSWTICECVYFSHLLVHNIAFPLWRGILIKGSRRNQPANACDFLSGKSSIIESFDKSKLTFVISLQLLSLLDHFKMQVH